MDKKRTNSDRSMVVFYVLFAISGAVGFFHFEQLPGSPFGTLVHLLYPLLSVSVCVVGVFTRWRSYRSAEFFILLSLSGLTILAGILSVWDQGWDGLSTGIILFAYPLLVVPYALLLQRHVISRRDLDAAERNGQSGE